MRILIIVVFSFCYNLSFTQPKLVNYVNPFIGTGGHGHTYPGATVPFGMVQLSPDNGTSGWDWCSGYHYSDSLIQGFSHTHLSGTGIGDLYDISVLPIIQEKTSSKPIKSKFSHQQETATPGYYAVQLKDFDIWAELTTTIRCGMHRYTFPSSKHAAIKFDLGFSLNWDNTTESYFRIINDTTFVGYRYSTGWAKDQKVYFAVRLSKPVKSVALFINDVLQFEELTEAKGKKVVAQLKFDSHQGEKVMMKVGLSFADIEGAAESLNEIPHWNFDEVKIIAENVWERELRKLQVRTDDELLKQKFYTALYHTYLAPTIFSDRFGNYKGADGKIHTGSMITSVHSLWDTFRAANPLLTLTQTELVPKIINSYLAFYDQYGLLPVWDLHFNETNTMTGYHAVPIIADAILKNISGFDYEKAFEAMKKSAEQNIRGTNFYREYGYVPQDKHGSSVTITLEYAFDDWCIAQVARKLKKNADFKNYIKRAAYWRNLFDKKRGFARPKDSKGKWIEPFDPYYSEHDFEKAAYTEGNAWQHSWFAPHDVYALINMHGGALRFERKLDSLFTVTSKMNGENVSPDISGMIGQYAHGNEPSHHIAYLYNYLGKPEKSTEKVREIAEKMYTHLPDGLSGNEDCGQMSAWYVFAVLGYYPVNPASGEFVIASPLVETSILVLPSGKIFSIAAKGLSEKNKYIQKATLNGVEYNRSSIRYETIMNGGVLEFQMGSTPSKTWGKNIEDLPGRFILK